MSKGRFRLDSPFYTQKSEAGDHNCTSHGNVIHDVAIHNIAIHIGECPTKQRGRFSTPNARYCTSSRV